MHRCLISFGANIGDPLATIQVAADKLAGRLCESSEQFRLSRFYRTPPIGGPGGQSPFINAVAAVETELDPWQVWRQTRQLEFELGRQRNVRWEARRIDLDILLFDRKRIWTPQLKIPHPRMCMRRFILLPAAEVAADWLDPVSQWTVAHLANTLRSGAANLAVLADSATKPAGLLAEVAKRTGARWHWPDGSNPSVDRTRPGRSTGDRWITQVDAVGIDTKLLVILAPPMPTTLSGVQWEDFNRLLAEQWNYLRPSSPHRRDEPNPNTIAGPRYLLAADNHEWAVQEMVAALEAMDCPIEPLG